MCGPNTLLEYKSQTKTVGEIIESELQKPWTLSEASMRPLKYLHNSDHKILLPKQTNENHTERNKKSKRKNKRLSPTKRKLAKQEQFKKDLKIVIFKESFLKIILIQEQRT